MPTIRLTLEYDGTDFAGWAAQPGLRTVEAELRAALDRVFPRWAGLAVAGRTDAGVHALGQVASLATEGGPPPERAAAALNAVLATDVAVVASGPALEGFDARFSARARSYRYRIWRRRTPSPFERRCSLWHPRKLDVDGLREAAALLEGEHDFRAFTPSDSQHEVFVRVVETARWDETGDVLTFTITADSFLRHMVRTLVGTMLELPAERIAGLLDGGSRAAAGSTAPACGLYLHSVRYDAPPAP
jgi:tRNA pseudouridine38-40 synthase